VETNITASGKIRHCSSLCRIGARSCCYCI